MPGGDGTGPGGMGPMTGRAAGYCAGYGMPGFMNTVPGRGFGRGLGRGMGLGFRGGRGWGGFRAAPVPYGAVPAPAYAPPYAYGPAFNTGPTPEQQLDTLKGQAEYLEDALDGIKKRIAELERNETAK